MHPSKCRGKNLPCFVLSWDYLEKIPKKGRENHIAVRESALLAFFDVDHMDSREVANPEDNRKEGSWYVMSLSKEQQL